MAPPIDMESRHFVAGLRPTGRTTMTKRTNATRRHSDERGAGFVEYALLVALIAIVALAAVTFLGRGGDDTPKSGGASTRSGSVEETTTTAAPVTAAACKSIYPDGEAGGVGSTFDCISPTVGGYDLS